MTYVIGGVCLLLIAGIGMTFLMVDREDLKNLQPAAIVANVQTAFDSRDNIKSDLEELSKRVEVVGRAIPKGDQTEASARKLLAFQREFEELMLRACRLAPKSIELDEATIKVHRDPPDNPPNNGISPGSANNGPPKNIFWIANLTGNPENKVTGAITKLTMLRGSVLTLITNSAVELPDPLTHQHELLDWTDEDRRHLAIFRLQGQLKRDFSRSLASIDPTAPTDSELRQLHGITDDFANRAKTLINESGKSRMLVFVPKGTAYNRQEKASAVALAKLAEWIDDSGTNNRQLQFLVAEARRLDEDIDSLIHRPKGTPLVLSERTSFERYQAMLDEEEKAKQERIAKAKKEEEDRRKAEAAKLAEAERKRDAEEARRKKEAEERAKMGSPDPSSIASGGALSGGRLGPPTGGGPIVNRPVGPRTMGPRGPSIPRGSTGSRLGLGANRAEPGSSSDGSGSRFRGGRPTGRPAMKAGPNDVTITVPNAGNLDTRKMLAQMPKWMRNYSVQMSSSNGKMRILIRNYDRDLSDLEPCFPDLRFESTDAENRVIKAKRKE